LWYIHGEFCYQSTDERVVKIGLRLLRLLANIKWLTFLRHRVERRKDREHVDVDVEKCHDLAHRIFTTASHNLSRNFSSTT